jgi:chemotaxis protein histidine kinase CheA
MTAPQALLEFFQKEAGEYLDQLEVQLARPDAPDAAAFLAGARALRGSATMTRLEGLPELASTLERIAIGLRDDELRWDEQLHAAAREALAELRDLVSRAPEWSESDQRQSRTRSEALANAADANLTTHPPAKSPAVEVEPIGRFFPDDGRPAILQRNPSPAITLAQRFRTEVAAAASEVARETEPLVAGQSGASQPSRADGVRHALLTLAAVADSYGAASISELAVRMARAPLTSGLEGAGVQALARLLENRELTDAQLATKVKQANRIWRGEPEPDASIISIETLLYRGHSAVARARQVRDQLMVHRQRGSLTQPDAQALFEELSDLLDLAVTT